MREIRYLPFIVAEVNPNTKDSEIKKFIGMELIFFPREVNETHRVILGPMSKEDMIKYWDINFEELKHILCDDKKEVIESIYAGEDGICFKVEEKELINIREAIREDGEKHDRALEHLINLYGLDKQRMEVTIK
ncbi:MAG: hypothetical protein KHY44_06045 [Clostridiales bacterium]|nr:hypothetical protein [Clostridiales bacterium]